MKSKATFLLMILSSTLSCTTNRNDSNEDLITGAYAREYSFQVIHPETGLRIGTRTIRDTIFVKGLEENYEISNHKWRLNDYDDEGWRNMEHAEDRPLKTFQAVFNSTRNSLAAETKPIVFFDLAYDLLFLNENRVNPYYKIK